eukprot:5951208-Prymnesium_polylepis.1
MGITDCSRTDRRGDVPMLSPRVSVSSVSLSGVKGGVWSATSSQFLRRAHTVMHHPLRRRVRAISRGTPHIGGGSKSQKP